MKLLCFIIFISILQVSAKGYSQESNLQLNFKNVRIKEILGKIEDQSQFKFLYQSDLIDVNKRIDLEVKDKKILEIMEEIFQDNPDIIFKVIEDKLIVISSLAAQQRRISGKISDENGQALPGVTVVVKGTTTGTVSDMDGYYTLPGISDDVVLIFSFVGMVTQEIVVGTLSSIDVTMVSEEIGIEEVVAIGYGTQKRVNLTGAVATVKSDDLIKVPVANTTNAITGRLPGIITKQESGEPGSDGTSMNIRGFGSPLIIVDGVERNFSDINAEEIESISVLKDASAAIYGARAGNGVLLITTKRGSIRKTELQYNNSFSFQGVASYPGFVNSGQYAELYREAELSDGIPEDQLTYSLEDIQNYYSGAPGYPNGDWWRAAIRDWSPQQQHNLSIKGGTEKIRFFGLLGNVNQQGMYTSGDNKMDRYNVRSNIDADITRDLTISTDLSGKVEYLAKPVTNTNGVFTNIFNAFPVYPVTLPDPTKVPYSGKGPQNPVAVTTRDISGYNDVYSNNMQGTFRLNYNFPFVKGLRFESRFDYFGIFNYTKKWSKSYDLYTLDQETEVYIKAASQPQIELNEEYDRRRMLTSQFSLNYERTFQSDHFLKGLFVYEIIDSKGNNFWALRREFLTSAIEQLYASGVTNQDLSGSAWEDGRISYIGRINYSFKGKYLWEGSFRYDGSNRFPADKRWGFFPSVSAAWRISEEDFMQNDWLDNLKLRLSYSQTGRDDTGMFQFLTGYAYSDDYIINDQLMKSIVSTGIPNLNITWETMTTYNAGIDISAFNNKWYAEIDAFYRLREGILATRGVSIPNTVGASLSAENLNSQSNRGLELSTGHQNNIDDLKYSVKGILSWARAKWNDFDEPEYLDEDEIRLLQKTGRWTNVIYGYKALGFFQNQEEIDAWELDQDNNGNATLRPGDIKYQDYNNDKQLDWRDRVEIGKTGLPEIMYSFILDMQYKRLDMSFLLQGSAEHYVEMDTRNVFTNSFPKPFKYMYEERWQDGIEDALYPRVSLTDIPNNTHASDFWLKPAKYVRIKNVNFGYTLPSMLVSKAGIKNFRIFMAGENLLTFSRLGKYGFDPESPKDQSGKYYPQMRTVSFGLNLTF